jgi:hypothetical protein
VSLLGATEGDARDMGENFPEGTSASDPSAVPPRNRDEDEAIEGSHEPTPDDEPTIDEEPENQQTG